ncbi:flagellar export chaperone FliS [Arthrobacter sp. H20]|uniref:flagellar export chaperone FliS n=1 Tax=Arthrobacter sp. H20 TaxID=1267981 RepID=UPI00047D5C9A|nr:flagellar export chaperone FliS [Arthrobacter sp. H20]
MTTLTSASAKRAAYNRDAVLSASPSRLLTMLYDRLMLDLARAETAQQVADWSVAAENLIHAQAIITELNHSLDTDKWDGANGLKSLYSYVMTTLIDANISRNVNRTRECIALLEPVRQAWHEAAAQIPVPAATAGTGTLGFA